MHDTHVHIAMSPLKENIFTDIEEFIVNGGKKILAQTTDIADYSETISLVEEINRRHPNITDLALGLHPTIFSEGLNRNNLRDIDLYKYAKKQIDLFNDFFNKNKRIAKAIGEVGIDYFEMNEYIEIEEHIKEQLREIQKNTFRQITKLAVDNNLPMSIHSRDSKGSMQSTEDILGILAQEGKGLVKGIFHSYTGEIEPLEDILNLGFYIGFNGIITYPSGENVREILKRTPVERIVLETDGPFLPTQSIRKNRKEIKRYGRPVMIREILNTAAEIKNVPAKKFEEILDNNYYTIFGN